MACLLDSATQSSTPAGWCYPLQSWRFADVASRGSSRRSITRVPWIIRNWIWVGNPFAPFFNSWFPNPFYSAEMESAYLHDSPKLRPSIWWDPIRHDYLWREISRVFGPVFLLSPFALLALRPQGQETAGARRLRYSSGAESRRSIPDPEHSVLSLAMGLALQNSPGVSPRWPHSMLLSLPPVMPPTAPIGLGESSVPVRVAIGLEPKPLPPAPCP